LIESQELRIKKELLKNAIDSLNPRYKEIFTLRVKSPPCTLKEISQMFGISQERVRQIHAAATEKIKCYIKKNSKGLGITAQ